MKTTSILISTLVWLSLGLSLNAQNPAEMNRINDLVTQARNLADQARSAASPTTPQSSADRNSNPFRVDGDSQPTTAPQGPQGIGRNAQSGGLDFTAADGTRIGIGPNGIGLNVGGQQFNVPRRPVSPGDLHAPDMVDPQMAMIQTMPVRNSNVTKAMEQAATYQAYASALQDLRTENYQQALAKLNRLNPDYIPAFGIDQAKSLCYFSLGQFERAAEHAYTASRSRGLWNWGNIRAQYQNPQTYAEHYVNLQQAAKGEAGNRSLRFLAGIHHLMLGHYEHAHRELSSVQNEMPNDPVLKSLVEMSLQGPPKPIQ